MSAAKQFRRYGPIAVAVLVIAGIATVATLSGSDDDGGGGDTESGKSENGGYEAAWGEGEGQGENVTLPEGVIPFSVAEREDLDVDWPATCDTEKGRMALPVPFPAECFAPFEGDNGGATAQGVTADAIKLVLYQAIDNDPVTSSVVSGVGTPDTPAKITESYQDFLPMMEEYFETYGRKVDLVVYKGTGTSFDEVAARADAVQIAEEIKPFAVFGGPLLTNAFEDELSAHQILSLDGGAGAEPQSYFADKDPYLFQLGIAPWQAQEHLIEYITKKLAGRKAVHAGDPAFRNKERKFGLIAADSGPDAAALIDNFEKEMADADIDLAEVGTFASPLSASADAPGIIAAMKDAGVTSVILPGDLITPGSWTRTATQLDYHPEWIIGGGSLIDYGLFARTFDQEQWDHAFGISFLSARLDPEEVSAKALYRWYHCAEPPARDGVEAALPLLSIFYNVLQVAGPNLTHEAFRNALFAIPWAKGLTTPSISWGEPDKGIWDKTDYQGIDDATEIWWDSDLAGQDESGHDGLGMYHYVDGGRRYMPGEWTDDDSKAFEEEGSVVIYESSPPGEEPTEYPSPC